eukprot:5645839-Alexandrium_andersonii.AAC.1
MSTVGRHGVAASARSGAVAGLSRSGSISSIAEILEFVQSPERPVATHRLMGSPALAKAQARTMRLAKQARRR